MWTGLSNLSGGLVARVIVFCVLCASEGQSFLLSPSYIPLTWKSICSENITPVKGGDKNTASNATANGSWSGTLVYLTCVVPQSYPGHWKLMDLRDWIIAKDLNKNTVPGNRSVVYKVSVTCEPRVNVSLPWPMRVPGLEELYVSRCLLVDKWANYNDPVDATIPDEMRILDIRHGRWLLNRGKSIISNSGLAFNLSNHFDCGQDQTLEVQVARNVSDDTEFSAFELPEGFPLDESVKPEDRLIEDAEEAISDQKNVKTDLSTDSPSEPNDLEENFLINLRRVQETLTKCEYEKMRVLDESMSPITSIFHFEILVQNSRYPVVEIMNYSNFGLREMPEELSQWRRYFPRLEYLDLTYNNITEVKILDFASSPDTGIVTFDLRYNNISKLTMGMLNDWAKVKKFHINIRHNPIHCGCDLSGFIHDIHKQGAFTGALAQYEYVKDLTCHSPQSIAGKRLFSLSTSALPCPTYSDNTPALISLGVIMVFLLVIIIVIIRYKLEIRILLYTRLHIRLPWDSDALANHKQFDAFVSYCSDDAHWVYENLVKFLENSPKRVSTSSNSVAKYTSSSTEASSGCFRLCIHERDFVPGKTIFDNIVESIESSRHTIIVLSPSFMKSHWAMEELRQAYRQSLVEKTRHLIVLLLEKVPKDDMDPLISRCCKTFTYLDVADTLFKDRLVFSLTTKDRGAKRRDKLAAREREQSIPSQRVQVEPAEPHDNLAFSTNSSGRPCETVRELSNTSTCSTSPLTTHC